MKRPSYVVIIKDPEQVGTWSMQCATRAEAQLAAERAKQVFRRNGYPMSYRIVQRMHDHFPERSNP